MRGGTPQAGRHAAAQLQVSSSCRRYPTLLERQVVDRRQLTGKMKSTAHVIGMSGTASPRRTIVLSLAKANSVILGPLTSLSRPVPRLGGTGQMPVPALKSAVPASGTLSCLGGKTNISIY